MKGSQDDAFFAWKRCVKVIQVIRTPEIAAALPWPIAVSERA